MNEFDEQIYKILLKKAKKDNMNITVQKFLFCGVDICDIDKIIINGFFGDRVKYAQVKYIVTALRVLSELILFLAMCF